VLVNSEESGALSSMQYRLLDHYLALEGPDWIAAVSEVLKARIGRARETYAKSTATTADQPKGSPSLPLEKYAGTYRDDWYGKMTIDNTANGLAIRFEHTKALAGPLEHVRYDTFRSRWADRTIEDTYVTFALNPDGTIERVTLRAVSPLADFSFDYHDLLFRPEKKR
jgi:hypothetical protein